MDHHRLDDRGVGGGGRTYCVTGATGYIGSWLVKSLLEKGYTVNATVRNLANCDHLLALWRGGNRLKLFRADLHEEGSFDEAVQGCDGVFHVAASMDDIFDQPVDDGTDVESNVIKASINGVLNILKSCMRSNNSVKRVVLTSSISTLTARNEKGEWVAIVDESCRIPVDVVRNNKSSGWVYVLSKRLTEDAAFQFAKENNIQLVSIITTTVAGPFLTSTVPLSIRFLLSPITGDNIELLPLLSAVNSRMGSIALVHTQDICNAHLYLMEHDEAQGRYICSTNSCTLSELLHHFAQLYPSINSQRAEEPEMVSVPTEISSKKLKDLGFRFNYTLQEVIHQTVDSCIDYGFLPPIKTVRNDLYKSTTNYARSTTSQSRCHYNSKTGPRVKN